MHASRATRPQSSPLPDGNPDFLAEDGQAFCFSYFPALQTLRTKPLADRLAKPGRRRPEGNLLAVLQPLHHILGSILVAHSTGTDANRPSRPRGGTWERVRHQRAARRQHAWDDERFAARGIRTLLSSIAGMEHAADAEYWRSAARAQDHPPR